MRELLEKVIGLIPSYIGDLLRLLQGPKTFIAERLSRRDSQLKNAIVFLAISILAAWLLEPSFIRLDPVIDLAVSEVFMFVSALAYGVAACLAWRIVKGRAELSKFFVVNFYCAGVFKIILSCWILTMVGVLKAMDPALYRDFMKAAFSGNIAWLINSGKLQESAANLPMTLVWLAGSCAMLVWLCVGWGAYRELNSLSKARSALAAVLFLLFCYPVTIMIFLVAIAAQN